MVATNHGDRRDGTGPAAREQGLLRPAVQAAAIVAVTGVIAALARRFLQVQDVEMVFVLGVMTTALLAGRSAAVLAAALSVAVFDWFFVPPYYTLDVADPRYITTFAVMFVASLITGTLVVRLREQRESALARARRTDALHAATREFAGVLDAPGLAGAACRAAAEAFQGEAAWFEPRTGSEVAATASEPPGSELRTAAADLAEWVIAHDGPAGSGSGRLELEPFLCVPVRSFSGVKAALAVRPRDDRAPTAEQRNLLEAMAQGAALAFDRIQHAEAARRATLEGEREALRSKLLSSVSHDLRTPLATITGAATALREDPDLDPLMRRDLTDSIVEEAERLERLVANLLDMTRLEGGAVTPRREWVPVEEVVGGALTRLERQVGGRSVEVTIEPGLPLLWVDPVLLGQAVVNVLENALKHTPPGTGLAVSAQLEGDSVRIGVADRGPGVAPGEEERVFERFHRGSKVRVGGVGLGLPIARAIARVHGGELVAAAREGGGAVFRFMLPLAPGAPVMPVDGDAEPGAGEREGGRT